MPPDASEIRVLRGHKLPITCLVITTDEKYIFSSAKDCSIIKCWYTFKIPKHFVFILQRSMPSLFAETNTLIWQSQFSVFYYDFRGCWEWEETAHSTRWKERYRGSTCWTYCPCSVYGRVIRWKILGEYLPPCPVFDCCNLHIVTEASFSTSFFRPLETWTNWSWSGKQKPVNIYINSQDTKGPCRYVHPFPFWAAWYNSVSSGNIALHCNSEILLWIITNVFYFSGSFIQKGVSWSVQRLSRSLSQSVERGRERICGNSVSN